MQIDETQVNEAFKIQSLDKNLFTLVESSSGQSMHSIIGPEAECKTVYIEPTWHWLRKMHSAHLLPAKLCLWDVGMGTASNVIYFLDKISGDTGEFFGNTITQIQIESFELHPEGLKKALEHLEYFPFLRNWESRLKELLAQRKSNFTLTTAGQTVEVQWTLHTENFLDLLQKKPLPFHSPHLVYFDFYSPGKNPELWSEAVFSGIRENIPNDVPFFLLTYSASTKIRVHLLESGFFIGKGPKTTAKDEGTQAALRLEDLSTPLGVEFRKKILTSAVLEEDQRKRILLHSQFASI